MTDPEDLAAFIRRQVESGKVVMPYIDTTSIEYAIAVARNLNGEIGKRDE